MTTDKFNRLNQSPPKLVNFTRLWIIAIIGASITSGVIGFSGARLYDIKNSTNFYDGEGNTIPYHAVDSLVQSQFIGRDFTIAGRDTIRKYFNQ